MTIQIGDRIPSATLNFLKLVAKNRRLPALPEMIKAYATILSASKGEIAGAPPPADCSGPKP